MSALLHSIVPGAVVLLLLFTATWMLSRKLDNYSFVDITWSYGFTALALIFFATSPGWQSRRALMLGMVAFWSLRLGTHLLLRIRRHHPHEDVRYQALREKWTGNLGPRFFVFFQAQAVSVLVLSAPVFLAMRNVRPDFHALEWAGLVVWLCGVAGESLADRQMNQFKLDPANRGKVCQAGLWRYSRHPNYFFESIIWWGFWIFACGSPWGWAAVFAPLTILWLLLRVTGIPLTEKCSVASRGDAYREYQRTTSAFIPWFRKS